MPGMPKTNTTVLVALVLAAVLFVAFIVYLSATGKETSDALELIVMLVPVLFLQVLNSVKIGKIDAQTNGNLTAQFRDQTAAINEHTTSVVGTDSTQVSG